MAINAGGALNATPAVTQQTVASAYLDLANTANQGWAQQYMPELMEKEAEVFGNRTVSGFLEMVGAEEAMASDQVVWSEQGRLHLAYKGTVASDIESGGTVAAKSTITITTDIDNNSVDGDGEAGFGIRVGDMVSVSSGDKVAIKCYISAVTNTPGTATTVVATPYATTDLVAAGVDNSDAITLFVFGSEYEKGKNGRGAGNSNEAMFKSYSNQPIIMKDLYEVSGSDAAQIGWVEVTGEDGQNGYLWYLKSAGDTRQRFADYCEMAMIEAEKAVASAGVATLSGNLKGTEGLFAAIESRGNVQYQGNDINAAAANNISLADFDEILKEFDKQGAIEEYMIFCNRDYSLQVDDLLASMNSYGGAGTSYGVFNNEADMALNLGFNGFRRGSYDFYKTDWKYLNDAATRGSSTLYGTDASVSGFGASDANNGGVLGAFIPAGVSSVYDQSLGKNLKRPFLHVRYRASGMEDRKFKTWTTGSVGASTSDLDAMEMHFLTERCLVVQGANNFMLLRG
tara:strand:- start:920 stop:2458 length:1539 start_codon:yes stop_codon:yes gene_type:complete